MREALVSSPVPHKTKLGRGVNPVLGRQRQKGLKAKVTLLGKEFEAILGYKRPCFQHRVGLHGQTGNRMLGDGSVGRRSNPKVVA